MDVMALLCTLHADGPATLRVLRESGCAALDDLEELGDQRLAELLDIPPAAARRLLREARALRSRVGEELLEREEAPFDFAAKRAAEVPGEEAAYEDAAHGEAAHEGQPLGSKDRDLMQKVLSSWRERDAGDGAGPAKTSPAFELPRPVPAGVHAPEPEASEWTGDEAEERTELAPGSLDGLTEECCRRLADAGIDDVELLLATDALELMRSSGLSYTLIQRLKFLARRGRWAADPASALPAPPTRPRAPTAALLGSVAGPVILLEPDTRKFSAAGRPHTASPRVAGPDLAAELRPPPASEPRAVERRRGSQGENPGGPFA